MSKTTEQSQAIAEQLIAGARRRRRLRRIHTIVACTVLVGAMAMMVADRLSTGHWGGSGWISLVHIINFGGFLLGRSLADKQAAAAAAAMDDVSMIGPLLEVLERPAGGYYGYDREIRKVVTDALARLLPQATSVRLQSLSALQMDVLRKLPAKSEDVRLRVAALDALAALADTKALPMVERLAARPAHQVQDDPVAVAASRALPILRAAQEREEASQALLRPTEAPDAPDTRLLRPVGHTESDLQNLLRPSREGQTAVPQDIRTGG
jgi:hypothetical protein